MTAKDKLLGYCKNLVSGFPVEPKNLTTDFSDGKVLACMINAKKPNVLDTKAILKSPDKLDNMNKIMDCLDKEFEVPHVIEAGDIVDEPDEKSMMTFLSMAIEGLEKFPTVANDLGDEELLEETENVESAPPSEPKVDTVAARALALGRGKLADSDAYFVKNGEGKYVSISWKVFGERALMMSRALITQGIEKGDCVCIVGQSSLSWVIIYIACQIIGAIPVGIYATSGVPTVKHVLSDCGAKLVFVFSKVELAKVLKVKSELKSLQKVILFSEAKGEGADGKDVLAWDNFLTLSEKTKVDEPEKRLAKVQAVDPATYIYTSGTTGPPKGVVLSHANIAWTSLKAGEMVKLTSEDCALSYLPLSHIAEQMFTILIPCSVGYKVYFYENKSKILANLVQVQPTIVFGPPRIWEKLYAGLGRKAPFEKLSELPEKVKAQLLQAVGLGKCRFAISGAAPINAKVLNYFGKLDRTIYEVYGQSEDCGPTSMNLPGAIKIGTVGKATPGTEVKIADDDEILVKGPHVFSGYHNNKEETEKVLKDGWLYSGDLGKLDDDGFLTIIGRKKDIIITAGGKNISPINIETALALHPFISNATVVGDKRKYLTALLSPDHDVITQYCKEKELKPKEFFMSEPFNASIKSHVDLVNKDLSPVEKVKKYTMLPVSFSVEGGELTPSMKVKRAPVNNKYAKEIELMYTAATPDFDGLLSKFILFANKNGDKVAFYVKGENNKWEPIT